MTEENRNGGGGRKRRRRKRRRGGSGSSNNSNQNRSGSRQSGGNNNNRRRGGGNKSNSRTPKDKLGGREPVDATAGMTEGPLHLNAFELFCSYHLGITPTNGYKKPNIRDVARYFDRSTKEIESALAECGMDNRTAKDVDFDFSLAQLDVRVAPEGIDRKELARPFFEEFVEANENFVDWAEPKIDYSSEVSDDEEE